MCILWLPTTASNLCRTYAEQHVVVSPLLFCPTSVGVHMAVLCLYYIYIYVYTYSCACSIEFDDFYNFHKTLESRHMLANKKSRRAFYTFHIVPGLQNINFDDFGIVYTYRLIFIHILEFSKDHFPRFVNSIVFTKIYRFKMIFRLNMIILYWQLLFIYLLAMILVIDNDFITNDFMT